MSLGVGSKYLLRDLDKHKLCAVPAMLTRQERHACGLRRDLRSPRRSVVGCQAPQAVLRMFCASRGGATLLTEETREAVDV
jgi:hypothetical protein